MFHRKPKKAVIEIKGNVAWKYFQSESSKWIGICDSLSLTLQADSYSELVAEIGEAMEMMFNDLLATDELENFLRVRGWQMSPTLKGIPKNTPVTFDMPITISRTRHDLAKAVHYLATNASFIEVRPFDVNR